MKKYRRVIIGLIVLLTAIQLSAQDSTLVLSTSMMNDIYQVRIAYRDGWVFKKGHNPDWAKPDLKTTDWQVIKPTELTSGMADENGRLEGWLRLKIRLDSSFAYHFPGIGYLAWAASEIYIDGELFHAYGNTGIDGNDFQEFKQSFALTMPLPTKLKPGTDHVIAIHFVDYINIFSGDLKSNLSGLDRFIFLTGPGNWESYMERSVFMNRTIYTIAVYVGLMAFLLWLLTIINKERYLLYVSIGTTFQLFFVFGILAVQAGILSFYPSYILSLLLAPFIVGFILSLPVINAQVFENRIPKGIRWIVGILAMLMVLNVFIPIPTFPLPVIILSLSICLYYPIRFITSVAGSKWAIVSGLILFLVSLVIVGLLFQLNVLTSGTFPAIISLTTIFLIFPLSLLVYVVLRFREMIIEEKQNSLSLIKLTEEKKKILEDQNLELEKKVEVRTSELNQSLEDLKSTQSQLIHAEKMASLGELTAGIAHEIQNPLNFVNNFSEVSSELLEELKEELKNGDYEEVKAITGDVMQNLKKILQHGNRASGIVQSMLQHSRAGSGEKELTDINKLADEYLRLSYHGLRAKDKSFNADFKTHFDESLPKINIVSQDIGRVLLNLINNAFFVVHEKSKENIDGYKPEVLITTKKTDNKIEICVNDNGNGIPQEIIKKIFQPFFTTKSTGVGTGLGLSLSYDIVTKGHGGEIKVETKQGQGSEFIIVLPV